MSARVKQILDCLVFDEGHQVLHPVLFHIGRGGHRSLLGKIRIIQYKNSKRGVVLQGFEGP